MKKQFYISTRHYQVLENMMEIKNEIRKENIGSFREINKPFLDLSYLLH